MSLDLGLVVAIHPEDNSVDLVMVEDGARLAGVQCLAAAGASIRSGRVSLVAPGAPDAGDKWSVSGKRRFETVATIDYVGRGRMPVVTGFLFPQVCQMLFDRVNFHVDRHPSDWYHTIDDAGNAEWSHPSGSFIRMAESPEHEDLSALDFDKKWSIDRNTGRAPWLSLTLKNAGSQVLQLRVDPSGNATLTHTGNLTTHTEGNASVTVDGTTSVVSGGTTSVVSGGAASLTAPSVLVDSPNSTFTGHVAIQGGLAVTGGTGATVAGNMAITGGNVTADGVGLKTHTHPDPQGGSTGVGSG